MTDTDDTQNNADTPFEIEMAPLDQPPALEGHDWGGDGSDLSRPVRAHVLAALVLPSEPYPPPVDGLMRLGNPRDTAVVIRRQALGIQQQHVSHLVRMVRDRTLNTANSDSIEVWAPIHAIQVLTELDISDVIPDMIPLFDVEDDWNERVLPEMIGATGAVAFEPLQRYLADSTRWAYGRAQAAEALQEIATQHPELRDHVIEILSEALQHPEQEHEVVNTFVIGSLVDLDAVDTIPLIRRAYASGNVDEMAHGDWGAVLDILGVEPEPDDPLVHESARRWKEKQERFFPSELREQLNALWDRADDPEPVALPWPTAAPEPRPAYRAAPAAAGARPADRRAHKEKNKRKMASASRKANQGKRKRK